MNKSELVSEIQANLGGASKADAENALSAVLASVKTAIKKAGKTVKVSDKDGRTMLDKSACLRMRRDPGVKSLPPI